MNLYEEVLWSCYLVECTRKQQTQHGDDSYPIPGTNIRVTTQTSHGTGEHADMICGSTTSKPDEDKILIYGAGDDSPVNPDISKYVTFQPYSILILCAMRMEQQSRAKDLNEREDRVAKRPHMPSPCPPVEPLLILPFSQSRLYSR